MYSLYDGIASNAVMKSHMDVLAMCIKPCLIQHFNRGMGEWTETGANSTRTLDRRYWSLALMGDGICGLPRPQRSQPAGCFQA